MKIWTQSCRFSLRTRKSSKTRGNFHFVFICFSLFFHFFSCFYHFFIMFFSFSLPVAPEIQESHEKQWKTIKNKGKLKKNEVANEKKMKIWTQSCRFSLRTRKSSKTRKFSFVFHFFHFFIVFFIFLSFFYHLFIICFSFSLPVAPEIQESHEKQ